MAGNCEWMCSSLTNVEDAQKGEAGIKESNGIGHQETLFGKPEDRDKDARR